MVASAVINLIENVVSVYGEHSLSHGSDEEMAETLLKDFRSANQRVDLNRQEESIVTIYPLPFKHAFPRKQADVNKEYSNPTMKYVPSVPAPHIGKTREERNPLCELQKVAQKTFYNAKVKVFEKAMDDLMVMLEGRATDLTKPCLTKDQVVFHLNAIVGGYSNVFGALASLRITIALSDGKTAENEGCRDGGVSAPDPKPKAESKSSLNQEQASRFVEHILSCSSFGV
ncbi:hypothetical protein BGZ82_008268 [Podila clonocystis]|nr:hypothetical protein BGZ82_008268 [Podila clonocystis]